MNELILKYNNLDGKAKKEVQDFIDFLLAKSSKMSQRGPSKSYRQKILSVSTWTKEDLLIFEKNRNLFTQWTLKEW